MTDETDETMLAPSGGDDGPHRPFPEGVGLLETAAEATAQPTAADRLSPGDQLGRYLVTKVLGAGAMGVVYAAYDPELDRKVAIKVLKHAGRDREAARVRLQREAQALAKLQHPNVVSVYDVGLAGESVFVAMAFVDGQTLGAWLAQTPRSWREVLEAFSSAGRGLAAAHDEGLVHRDFKPDNVMVGRDGQARVMDFGLARAANASATVSESPVLELTELSRSASALGTPLTQTGAVMGTPAYMAPEQFVGLEASPRSDQFSFCVALFEALHGARPFAGESVAAIAFAVTQGNLDDSVKGGAVPAWLDRVLRRGLAPAAEDRFPDMRALLAALEAGEARRRRFLGAVVMLGLVALGAALLGGRQINRTMIANACEARGDAIVTAWADAGRARVRDGLDGVGASYAKQATGTVLALLDTYAQDLGTQVRQTCEAAERDGDMDAEHYGRARWCLETRTLAFDRLVDALSQADVRTLERAVQAASSLPPPERCGDRRYLEVTAVPEVSEREALTEPLDELARAQARRAAGDPDGALIHANASLARAEQLAFAPLIAASKRVTGSILADQGAYEESRAALTDAYFLAVDAGAAEVQADAAVELVFITGNYLEDLPTARLWARHAEAALRFLGDDPGHSLRFADLASYEAVVDEKAGDYARAKSRYEAVLELRSEGLGPGHPAAASTLANIANCLDELGLRREAVEMHKTAIDALVGVYGPNHPKLSVNYNNLAAVHFNLGDSDRALELFERTVTIRRAAYGDSHPKVASALNNLASVHNVLGHYESALETHLPALAVREATLGPDHPEVALSLNNIAIVRRNLGEFEAAVKAHERAAAIWESAHGPEHPTFASILNNLAAAYRDVEDYESAEVAARRALKLRQEALGADPPDLSYVYVNLAYTALERGRFEEARRLAERGVAVLRSNDAGVTQMVDNELVVAEVEWRIPAKAGGDRSAAVRHARAVRAEFLTAKGAEPAIEQIDAWLAEHR